jgi:selenocysteine lyase/cysteine desulfurase
MDINTIRAGIPALKQAIYLNTGTFGPSPSVVLDEVRRALDLIEQHGPYSPFIRQTVEREGYEWARSEAAALLEVTPDEIALTRNASDGINIIAYGLDWRPGDEVVISNQEHPSGILPWLTLARRFGIHVRVAPLDANPEILLQEFEERITARTRLVFASHVSGMTGAILPVQAICQLAHQMNALAVVDGAHALGQFPVRVREIGCDAYVGCGHKWLLGPQGASFLYIAREHLTTFQPSWIGWGAHEEYSLDLDSQTYHLQESARRFEFGTKQWALFPGLARAIRFIKDEVTLPAVQAHVQPLARRLKQAIDSAPHLERLTPMEPELSAGIVSLTLRGDGLTDIKERLWERHNVIVAYDPPQRRLRLSVGFFTTEAELERALEAIQDCLASLKDL